MSKSDDEITVTLTREKWDRVVLNLWEDEGPAGHGWTSPELEAVRNEIERQVNAQG